MEPVALHIATADSADIDELATVAACTFPLACPPSVTPENIASFVETSLSVACFAGYLADPQRMILVAQHDDRIVGYAMLVREADAVELSKIYVLQDLHGTGASTALMEAVLASATELGGHSIWLGVNQQNLRAQRFYAKHGFMVNGTRTFRVGAGLEHDYVMTRAL
ncbi:MAG: GNAT family N-acetyltransferase [Mycobacterium sp.]